MSDLILRILPLAIAAAINPTGILVVIALLATAKRSAFFLTAGFCAVFIVFGAVVLALGLQLELKPSATTAVIDIVAAALILVLGVRSLRKKKPAGDGQPAKKRRKMGPAESLVAGMALAAADFSSIIPYLDALKDMVVSDAGAAAAWTALAVFLVICLTPMVAPVALAYAAPQSADKVLGPLRRTLQKHGGAIMAVVCFVLAAYLAIKGVSAL